MGAASAHWQPERPVQAVLAMHTLLVRLEACTMHARRPPPSFRRVAPTGLVLHVSAHIFARRSTTERTIPPYRPIRRAQDNAKLGGEGVSVSVLQSPFD